LIRGQALGQILQTISVIKMQHQEL
jgi:hypothetical protein